MEIYSESDQQWIRDGEVEEVVTESIYRDGLNVRAGSMKITYNNGMRFKWVAPQQMEQYLRPSPRPRPPDPIAGELYKETHALWRTWHQQCYCELNKGFLMWWDNIKQAENAEKPAGYLFLMGMKLTVERGRPDKNGVSTSMMRLCSTSSHGAISVFKRADGGDLSAWEEALWSHAVYTDEAHDYFKAKEARPEIHKEFLQVLARQSSQHRKSITPMLITPMLGSSRTSLQNFF